MSKKFFAVALSFLFMLSASGIALGYDFGSRVAAGDTDAGHALAATALGGFRYFPISGPYSAADPVYLIPAAGGPSDRLTPIDAVLPGHLVNPAPVADPDFVQSLLTVPLPAPAIVYLPIYGDGVAYHPADPVYLVSNTAAVPAGHLRANDIRMSSGNPNGIPGSKIVDFSADNGMLYTLMPGAWGIFFDNVDQVGGFSLGDELYLHNTAGGPAMVLPGDIRLTVVP